MNSGRRRKPINLNPFGHPLPSRHDVENEVFPNPMLDLGFMPLLMFKDYIIAFDPNGPKRDATEKVTNFDHLSISLRNYLPEESLLPIESVVIVRANPTIPCPSSLYTSPEFMLDSLTRVGRRKMHCLEIEAGAIRALHSLTTTTLCLIDHMNSASFPDPRRSHTCN